MSRRKAVNPVLLLHQREVSGKKAPKLCGRVVNPERELRDWVEGDFLRNCTSSYCNPRPPPRSTIATSFSPDGRFLASTHGDHTVKITCCRTGALIKVLGEHQRTPWVVRFHPRDSNILASGSLDSFVRIWDLETGRCIQSHQFGRPISSISFHAGGDELAVASGHRMYIWRFNEQGLTKPIPVLALKTRRSLRAVQYHPQGAPLILTAEVNPVGGSSRQRQLPVESTGLERRRQAPPATPETIAALELQLRHRWLLQQQDLPRSQAGSSQEPHAARSGGGTSQGGQVSVEMDSTQRPGISLSIPGPPGGNGQAAAAIADPRLLIALQAQRRGQAEAAPSRPYLSLSMPGPASGLLFRHTAPAHASAQPVAIPQRRWTPPGGREAEGEWFNSMLPEYVRSYPDPMSGSFLEGMAASAQRQQTTLQNLRDSSTAVASAALNSDGTGGRRQLWPNRFESSLRRASTPSSGQGRRPLESYFTSQERSQRAAQPVEPPQTVLERISSSGGAAEAEEAASPSGLPDLIDGHWSGSRQQIERQPFQPSRGASNELPRSGRAGNNRSSGPVTWGYPQPPPIDAVQPIGPPRHLRMLNEVQPPPAAPVAEHPAHVLVRVWRYDHSAAPEIGPLQMVVHNATLCSEMGVHMSPCGRMLALCVAVQGTTVGALPAADLDLALGTVKHELLIYSLEAQQFGKVLHSRPLAAAHCMTSLQFSPRSKHIVVAYGRHHSSLIRRDFAGNADSIIPMHTVLEVYRIRDMQLVRVLPSADDEVNTAGFHPIEGGGIAYGTKEGRLRVLSHANFPLNPYPPDADLRNAARIDELLANADSSDYEY